VCGGAASLRPLFLRFGLTHIVPSLLRPILLYTFAMDPQRDLGRTLFIIGLLLAVAGALLYFSPKLPFRLGRLPGDIVHRGEHSTFYFPITTSIVVSVALSFLLWLLSQFRR
jgi:hypothetical protein